MEKGGRGSRKEKCLVLLVSYFFIAITVIIVIGVNVIFTGKDVRANVHYYRVISINGDCDDGEDYNDGDRKSVV